MNLDKVAMKLYYNKYDKPDSSLSKRCIDFKDMEKLAVQYSAENTQYGYCVVIRWESNKHDYF